MTSRILFKQVLTAAVAFVVSAPVLSQAQRAETDFNRDWKSADREVAVEISIFDPQGESVCTSRKLGTAPAGGSVEVDQQMFAPDPERWDLDHPNLYTAATTA